MTATTPELSCTGILASLRRETSSLREMPFLLPPLILAKSPSLLSDHPVDGGADFPAAIIEQAVDLFRLLDEVRVLWELQGWKRDMAACFKDAFAFIGAMPLGIPTPIVWTDNEVEVVFEWINGVRHAVVSLEGDHQLGFAMSIGTKVVVGSEGVPASRFPEQLREFLVPER